MDDGWRDNRSLINSIYSAEVNLITKFEARWVFSPSPKPINRQSETHQCFILYRDQLCKHVENQTSTTYSPTIKASLIRHASKATNDYSLCSHLVIIWLDIIFRSTFHPNNNSNTSTVSYTLWSCIKIQPPTFLPRVWSNLLLSQQVVFA